jgi:hypothetical protein
LYHYTEELAARQNELHRMQSGGDIMGRMSLDSRMSLGSDSRMSHGGGMNESEREEVRAAEHVARQSQERWGQYKFNPVDP